MKIEKISDVQIRCTISKQDLSERELKISELAYGNEKANALFSELMLQASYECGFDSENKPLMIEAIPFSEESLVLLVTKVNDVQDLDIQYSHISEQPKDSGFDEPEAATPSFADEILECFKTISDIAKKHGKEIAEREIQKQPKLRDMDFSTKVFSFDSLSVITELSKIIAPFYYGKNVLYKSEEAQKYYLMLSMGKHTPEQFNKVCNVAAEYGSPVHTRYASISYYEEHFSTIIKKDAVQTLATISFLSKH